MNKGDEAKIEDAVHSVVVYSLNPIVLEAPP